jgi:hypothetical protein
MKFSFILKTLFWKIVWLCTNWSVVFQSTSTYDVHSMLCFSVDSSVLPAATLEFGSLCLRNALMLLPEDPTLRKSPKRTTESDQNDNKWVTSRCCIDKYLVYGLPSAASLWVKIDELSCSKCLWFESCWG